MNMTATETHSVIANLFEEIQVPEKGILSHTVHNDESVKIILFGFSPGQELTAHTAPMPATIQVLRGEAQVTLGEDTHPAAAGCLIHMQPNLTHGIVAQTPVLMLLTLVKAGRVKPVDKTGR
jgi:quercetin dioxygenase-like cupin family protein